MSELVGVTEGARRLRARGIQVHASTVSRQVRKGVIPNHGTAERPLIDVDEAVAARAANLDAAKQRGPTAPLFRDPDPAAAPATSNGAAASPAARRGPSFQDARTAREAYQAKLAQLDYEQKSGALVARAEVEATQTAAARLVRDRLQALARRLAGELASLSDPVAVTRRLDEAFRVVLQDLSDEMNGEASQDAA